MHAPAMVSKLVSIIDMAWSASGLLTLLQLTQAVQRSKIVCGHSSGTLHQATRIHELPTCNYAGLPS